MHTDTEDLDLTAGNFTITPVTKKLSAGYVDRAGLIHELIDDSIVYFQYELINVGLGTIKYSKTLKIDTL